MYLCTIQVLIFEWLRMVLCCVEGVGDGRRFTDFSPLLYLAWGTKTKPTKMPRTKHPLATAALLALCAGAALRCRSVSLWNAPSSERGWGDDGIGVKSALLRRRLRSSSSDVHHERTVRELRRLLRAAMERARREVARTLDAAEGGPAPGSEERERAIDVLLEGRHEELAARIRHLDDARRVACCADSLPEPERGDGWGRGRSAAGSERCPLAYRSRAEDECAPRTFEGACDLCASRGGRLCSSAELAGGCAEGAGCDDGGGGGGEEHGPRDHWTYEAALSPLAVYLGEDASALLANIGVPARAVPEEQPLDVSDVQRQLELEDGNESWIRRGEDENLSDESQEEEAAAMTAEIEVSALFELDSASHITPSNMTLHCDCQPLLVCDRPSNVGALEDLETLTKYAECPDITQDKPIYVLKKKNAYGRTGNQLIEFLHAVQQSRDKGIQLGIHIRSWAMQVLTNMWWAVDSEDWQERFERAFCVKIFNLDTELKWWGVIEENAKDLLYYKSELPLDGYISSQQHALRTLYRNYNTGRGTNFRGKPVRDMCSGIDALFGQGRGDAVYSVVHSRSLEGEPGRRLLGRIAGKSGCDPEAALAMDPDYVKSILRPLGLLGRPVVVITDGQDPDVLERLTADPEVGPMVRLVPEEARWVGGDATLAVMSTAFIGECSSFSRARVRCLRPSDGSTRTSSLRSNQATQPRPSEGSSRRRGWPWDWITLTCSEPRTRTGTGFRCAVTIACLTITLLVSWREQLRAAPSCTGLLVSTFPLCAPHGNCITRCRG